MCGRRKKKGIKIHSGFICSHCEEEIVHTDVSDEKYPFFIQQMKKVWINNG
ncbi:inhibitor of sigma-G Gin [Tepidibacillus decaturensis]|uniref:Inhibitor of sigma-G Gin n=2 Tax=Bacillaceae TaxID=186817 RepID=A0A135L823_9BACI|nr:inhibitor of sigma-G Gin [Tepidibacillus decaturensis]